MDYLPTITSRRKADTSLTFLDDSDIFPDDEVSEIRGPIPKSTRSSNRQYRRPLSAESSNCSSSVGFRRSESDIIFHKDSGRRANRDDPHRFRKSDNTGTMSKVKQETYRTMFSDLEVNSKDDGPAVLKEKLNRLQQDKEALTLQVTHYREKADTSSSDLAGEKIKTSTLQGEIRNCQMKLSEKEQQITDLKCEIESFKQNGARQTALIQSLRQRIQEAEEAIDVKENAASRGDVTIASLKKEMYSQQDRLQQAEASLKRRLGEEENAARKAHTWKTKYEELCVTLAAALHVDLPESSSESHALIIKKVNDLSRDKKTLKDKAKSLSQNIQESDLESKASRETIMRLVAEVSEQKKQSHDHHEIVQSITREKDVLEQRVRELEVEVENTRGKIRTSQEAWALTRDNLEERESRLNSLEESLKTSKYTEQTAQSQLSKFRRYLGDILKCDDTEEDILHKSKQLAKETRDYDAAVERFQIKLRNTIGELEGQRSMNKTTLRRAVEAENQLKDINDRSSGLEGQLLTSDVERDQLREDRNKYMLFCEKLASTMKLDEIAEDAGLDVNGEALLARAKQLMKRETETLNDRSTTIYNLQRKLKWFKQQVESKELQLGLVQKKLSSFEEIVKDKSRVEVERDESSMKFKRLQKQCEKYQKEMLQSKQMVTDLKARLLETSELRREHMEQGQKVEDLERLVSKLAKSKDKTSRQLQGMKRDLHLTENEVKDEKSKITNSMSQLMNELNTVKETLEETRTREKQLLDFRQVLAKLLGLDVQNLSVPDFEIISRLERLVQAHHAHAITTHTLETSLHDMDKKYRAGYEDTMTLLKHPRT